jgi:hypothetical protein
MVQTPIPDVWSGQLSWRVREGEPGQKCRKSRDGSAIRKNQSCFENKKSGRDRGAHPFIVGRDAHQTLHLDSWSSHGTKLWHPAGILPAPVGHRLSFPYFPGAIASPNEYKYKSELNFTPGSAMRFAADCGRLSRVAVDMERISVLSRCRVALLARTRGRRTAA